MKKRNKIKLFMAVPTESVKVINPDKNRLVRAWFELYARQGRVFSMNGHYAIAARDKKNIYEPVTEEFFHVAQSLLSKKNPRFYFDIVKDDSSGVEIIKLQPERTYDCKVVPELSDLPENGIFSDKDSSFFISLFAYKYCFDICKRDGLEKLADEYAKRYMALRQSEMNKTENGGIAIDFGDPV